MHYLTDNQYFMKNKNFILHYKTLFLVKMQHECSTLMYNFRFKYRTNPIKMEPIVSNYGTMKIVMLEFKSIPESRLQ